MGITSLILTILGLILVIVGVVALINSSWIAGAIFVIVGLLLLGARGGVYL